MNEISGMVMKAARGAGIPLGHCEDMALAAGYLAATDPVRLDCIEAALTGPHTPVAAVWTDHTLQIAAARAAMAGPVAVDALRSGYDNVVLKDLDAPRLVLALFAGQGICVSHHFAGADLTISRDDGPTPPAPMAAAVTVSGHLWTYLGDLAARTYVRATDASRLAGAGAGLTDND
ncbi:MAG: DUF3726 domain-containing protein [Yoonia sp.]|nr:DUF3726 domain-containing protein [Yoonia sp.]